MIGIGACNQPRERGIPGRRGSTARVDHVPALCTHRPSLLPIERCNEVLGLATTRKPGFGLVEELVCREEDQTGSFRGSKSRNKVSVGEPAEGSLSMTILFISSNLTGLDTPVVATIMKGGHLRGACRPRRPFPNGLSRLPSPPLDSFRRREWEASFASGRSAVWRRAARPCTLGRPGVQVAKGSPVLDRGDEGV